MRRGNDSKTHDRQPIRIQVSVCGLAGVICALLLFVSSTARAQEPTRAGPFVLSGSSTVGFRFVDVNGRRQKYDEFVNLRQGPRVLAFSLQGNRDEAGPWLDVFSLDASGLGGEPFSQVRLLAEKKNIFRFNLDYRKSQYIYDPVDNALTDNHDFGIRRSVLSLNLIVDPERFPRTSFTYRRVRRTGTAFTTRHPFLITVNDPVAGFFGQQFNPFLAQQPLNEVTHMFTIGSDFTIRRIDFHLEQSFTLFDNDANYSLLSSPVEGLDARRPLAGWDGFSWTQAERTHTPNTTARVRGLITDRLEVRGAFVYFRSLGTYSSRSDEEGRIGFVSFYPYGLPPGTPYSLAVNGDGRVKNNTRIAELGFSYSVLDNLTIQSDYRYHGYDQSDITTSNVARTLVGQADVTRSRRAAIYNVDAQAVDTVIEYQPIEPLRVRAGLRYEDRDVDFASFLDGRFERDLSAFYLGRTRTTSWTAGFSLRPGQLLALRGEFRDGNTTGPYTRISPQHETSTKVRLRLRPREGFTFDGTYINHTKRSFETGYDVDIDSGSGVLFYQPVDRLWLNVGYTYEDFDLRSNLNFFTGVRPFRGVISRDRITDRLVHGGIGIEVTRDLAIQFSGQYLRSTGAGFLTGEAPRSGPITWPLGRIEASYHWVKVGELRFAYNRSYYADRVIGENSYSANLFAVTLTRNF